MAGKRISQLEEANSITDSDYLIIDQVDNDYSSKISKKNLFNGYVFDENYVHTDNNYTDEHKTKVDNIPTNLSSQLSQIENAVESATNAASVANAALEYIEEIVGEIGTGTSTTLNTVSVLQYGAIPNDPDIDNTLSINAAITAAVNTGCTNVYFPPGTYWISGTIDASNHDNMTYKGENATIKLSEDVTSFHSMMIATGNNIVIDGLTFDQNVNGRDGILMPLQNGNNVDIEARRSMCLKIDSTYENVTIRNCIFIGCGKWLLFFKANGGLIENCRVRFETPILPPTDSMENGYLKYYDVSAIYTLGSDIIIENVSFTASSDLLTPQTALEMHSTDSTVRDITVDGYLGGCIVSGAYVTADDIRNMLIENCTFKTCTAVGVGSASNRSQSSGISLWGGSSGNDVREIVGLTINNCRIETPWYGISLFKSSGDRKVKGVSIINTEFRYIGVSNTADRSDGLIAINTNSNFRDFSPCALCLATTGIPAEGITMSGCRVYDFPDIAVRANLATSSDASVTLFDRITITDNEFINCASSNPYVPQYTAVISLSNFSTATVSRNRFIYNLTLSPAPPFKLPNQRAVSYINKLIYTENSYDGYPDLSWAYVNNLDYPSTQFVFDATYVSVSDGVTRIPCESNFVSDGVSYHAIDGLALTEENVVASVSGVPLQGIAITCTGTTAMRIGDKIKVRTRPAYIYNILETSNESEYTLVGVFCGDDTTASSAYPSTVTTGDSVTLVSGIRTEVLNNLRANVVLDDIDRLPIASANRIGGITASPKTVNQTVEVGIDANGRLWTVPGNGASMAENITYDHTTSGLVATNIKDAIDELASIIFQLTEETLEIISASVSPETCALNTPVTITAVVSSNTARVVAFYTDTSSGIAQQNTSLTPNEDGTQTYTSQIVFGSTGVKNFTLYARDEDENQSEEGINCSVTVTAS